MDSKKIDNRLRKESKIDFKNKKVDDQYLKKKIVIDIEKNR